MLHEYKPYGPDEIDRTMTLPMEHWDSPCDCQTEKDYEFVIHRTSYQVQIPRCTVFLGHCGFANARETVERISGFEINSEGSALDYLRGCSWWQGQAREALRRLPVVYADGFHGQVWDVRCWFLERDVRRLVLAGRPRCVICGQKALPYHVGFRQQFMEVQDVFRGFERQLSWICDDSCFEQLIQSNQLVFDRHRRRYEEWERADQEIRKCKRQLTELRKLLRDGTPAASKSPRRAFAAHPSSRP